jgi:monofunctional biosynthetic peptidoglycan transglycosylase
MSKRRISEPAPLKRYGLVHLLRGLCLVLFALYGLCVLALFYLKWLPPLSTTVHLQRRAEAFFASAPYSKQYRFVPLSEMSPHLAHAAIAAEDARFFDHAGVDWQELKVIFDKAQRSGSFPRGGSTITQQLVKNVFLTTHRSLMRKAVEFVLTPLAELVLTKERILELYLNVVEWGPGVYGAEAAAQFHYGIAAQHLTRDQAARLVACLPAPLERRPQEMTERAGDIIGRMRSMGW